MGIELEILNQIQKLHTPFGDWAMVFLSALGNNGAVWILFTGVLLAVPRMRRLGFVLAAALCINFILCNMVLKPIVLRTRPCDVNLAVQLLIRRPLDFSFPSGHTSAGFTAVFALLYAGEKRLWKPTLILAGLIAFSRLYLYVHYPTDVLGGILVGVVSGWAGSRGADWIWKRRMGSSGV